jgi:hypothetical protein
VYSISPAWRPAAPRGVEREVPVWMLTRKAYGLRRVDNRRMAKSIVTLPAAVREPYQVFVNGIPQREGVDYQSKGRTLMFDRELRKDRISKRRWFLGAWGVGTYKQDDSIDVRYEAADGSPRVAEGLEIEVG